MSTTASKICVLVACRLPMHSHGGLSLLTQNSRYLIPHSSKNFFCRYWHRSLNPKKLIETRFSHLTRNMTLQRTIKLFKLPLEPKCSSLRLLTKSDVPGAHQLLKKYLEKFRLRPEFDEEEFEHWFMPRKDIVETYVVERNGTITGKTILHEIKYSTTYYFPFLTHTVANINIICTLF